MDFVAFDFETANARADSACQLAVVRVRGGQLAEERKWAIRPPQLYFSRRNIAVHGIRPEDVADAPTMEQVWPELHEFIDGQVLVAHNAGFDMRVLVSTLEAFDIACPYIEFSCTRAIARRTWPGRSGYGLKPLGTWLGVDFRHHDALEDSRCCAHIALAAAAVCETGSFHDLEKHLRLTRGRTSLGRISVPRTVSGRVPTGARATSFPMQAIATIAVPSPLVPDTVRGSHSTRLPRSYAAVQDEWRSPSRGQLDARALIAAAAGGRPLADKQIVCLGALRGLTIAETEQVIVALGATWQTRINLDTDYVIACGGTLIDEARQVVAECSEIAEPDASTAAPPSSHIPAATIRVLSERQLLALLPGGKAAVRW